MRVSLEEKRRQFWTIYQMMYGNARVTITDLSEEIWIDRDTASGRMKEAYEKGHIVGPHLRKRSYKDFAEYVCLVSCEDAL